MPYRTSENVIDGVVITFVDINPVKAVEKSLHRMSKVFIDGLDPMLILDVAGRIEALNDEAERTYGWSRQELMGQPVNVLVPKEGQEAFADQLRRCLQGDIIRNVDTLNVTKAGKALSGLLTYSLLTDAQGGSDGIALIVKFMYD